jgi:tripartite-type tricarboxylate transporter receptor subunit TctC
MNTMKFLGTASAVAAVFALSSPTPADAQSVADFYKGRDVSLIIGYGAGGGYDTYARLLARHMGRHIPGNPNVVPKNMPGAGALKAANFIATSTPKDGSHMGVFASSTAMDPLFAVKKSKAKFKPSDFTWIGNMNQETFSCGVWKSSKAQTFDDMIKIKEFKFGSTGPAAITSQHPRVFNNLAGANIKIVYGYKGTKGINLAMRQGEVFGSCGLAKSTIQSRWYKDIEKGDLKIIVQLGRKKDPFFGDAAHIFDYAKDDDARAAMGAIFGRDELGRPLAAAPGIPADRAAALRKAFVDTMKDPVFLADAKKTRTTINFHSGEEVDAIVAKFMSIKPKALELAKQAIAR